jgi:hypothetical protein
MDALEWPESRGKGLFVLPGCQAAHCPVLIRSNHPSQKSFSNFIVAIAAHRLGSPAGDATPRKLLCGATAGQVLSYNPEQSFLSRWQVQFAVMAAGVR